MVNKMVNYEYIYRYKYINIMINRNHCVFKRERTWASPKEESDIQDLNRKQIKL